MADRAERIVANEQRFRAFNEGAEEVRERLEHETLEIVCECGDADCTERLRVDPGRYAEIRQDEGRFIVLPGHEEPDVEDVLERGDGFLVVGKSG